MTTSTSRVKERITRQRQAAAAKNRRKKFVLALAGFAIAALVLGYSIYAVNLKADPTIQFETAKPGKGDVAPDLTLPSVAGGTFSLSQYRGKKNVLLYFQEGVGCDSCWKQIQDFQAKPDFFSQRELEVISITVDSVDAIKPVMQQFSLTLPVLSDAGLSVSRTYNMLGSGMHPGTRPAHSFVLVNKEGKILWRADYGGPPRNAMYVPEQEVLDAVAQALR